MIAFSDLTEPQKQKWEDYLVQRGLVLPGSLLTERRKAVSNANLRRTGDPLLKTKDYGVGIVDSQGFGSSTIAGMFCHWRAFLAAEGLLEAQRIP